MKKWCLYFTVIFSFLFPASAQENTHFKPLSYAEASSQADSILQLMTLDEKIKYIGGDNFFYTQKIKRLNIPAVPFVDATQGIRLNPAIINKGWKKPAQKTIAYPAPILLASTWNDKLAHMYAHSIGSECRAAGLPLLLGPGLNLYRNSQCGRNFEYFGEDPVLAGSMVAAYVKGLQQTGTIATLKHFIANQTDYYRRRSNSVVDERTLNEIYMPAFKRGIEAGAKAVMTSYNLVNGEWAGQSEFVIDHLLRDELGFQWLVMTDWFSVWDGEKVIQSGQDLEMPYRRATKNVAKLIIEGKVSEEDINRMVKSILTTFIAMGSFDFEKKPLTDSAYLGLEEVALNTAREGMVLLKNTDHLLPINPETNQKILLTGKYYDQWISGKGAGFVKGYDNQTLEAALKQIFGDKIECKKNPTDHEIETADVVLLSIGTEDREAADRPFDLPPKQEAMVKRCTRLNPGTVVIVTTGSGVNMSKWEDAGAILYSWYMGQNGATAAAEIITGKVNPSGKLPISIERSFEDSPAFGYLPDGEELYEGFKMRAELKREVYDVHYHEGVFVGYRWYDSKKIDPLFCFGHGLSYTRFTYSKLKIDHENTEEAAVNVTLEVKNTGSVYGGEIVQLYIHDKVSAVPRPEKELKAFAKVFLEPGESKLVELKLKPEDFMYWHPEKKKWTLEPGEFVIHVGASSRDIRLENTVKIF